MRILERQPTNATSSVLYHRCVVDLASREVRFQEVPCRNLEDVLGGFGRSFQILAERAIDRAYAPENPLIVNVGLLTGSSIMTAMRVYLSGYSPLKQSRRGLPAAMWSAGSGGFGNKLRWTGLDEIIFESRSATPVYALLQAVDGRPKVELRPASHLLGLTTHEKILALHREHPGGHYAAIGPAGEHYASVFMGAVALSTDNELKGGEAKVRFAGRGGMGSLMGYKNLVAMVAQSPDQFPRITPPVKEVNQVVVKGGGSARFQPVSQGGSGGTWANYPVLQAFHAVPQDNFRPRGTDDMQALFPENVEKVLDVRQEACVRCGIRCHNNIQRRNPDGSRGEFLGKFDYEPLGLFGPNLGIHDAAQVARLIHACDSLGMDAVSLGATLGYVLEFNQRHPQRPLANGATFGDFDRIHELVVQTGRGCLASIGQGLQRLSDRLGETSYAIHVKGLELPCYLPETNPGYAWAIAGGHMSMQTYLLLAKEGKTGLDDWVKAITRTGLLQVGHDMIGLCKFVGFGAASEVTARAIRAATGLELSVAELEAAVRRAFLRGLALERRQGYSDAEYTLPARVFEEPNRHVKLPQFVTREFFAELQRRVWEVFAPEMQGLLPEPQPPVASPAVARAASGAPVPA
jgi:aldehyde:ferredoxin oxidoreductase